MLLGGRGSRWRCLFVWVTGTSTLGALGLLVRAGARGVRTPPRAALDRLPLDRALVDLAAWVLLGCLVWSWLALTATVVEARRGVAEGPQHRPRHRPWHPPAALRRLVLAACGVVLASGVASPSVADDGTAAQQHVHGAALLDGLPLPDRAVAPRRHHATPRRDVVVRPGDSLWSIAERDLPAGAPDRAVVARWQAIYAANRSVIGPDPDLLEPGQRLVL